MVVYAYEIIKKEILNYLINQEKNSDLVIQAMVSVGNRSFFTLKSHDRRRSALKEKELILVRIKKNENQYEFITLIGKWGKINIPLEAVNKFSMENHENISIEIFKNKIFDNLENPNIIDLSNIASEIKGIYVFNRLNKFVTIYKKEQTPITLPRFIFITPDLIEAIYLMHGDGHYKSKLFFTNVNYKLHEFIIQVFDSEIGISKDSWKCRINHSKIHLLNKSQSFWSNLLKINKEKFYKTRTLSKFNTKLFGDLRIIQDNLIVAQVYSFLLNHVKLDSLKSNLSALNGLLDAEGSAQIGKRGLHKVTISFSSQEKNKFQEILTACGLDFFFTEQNSRFCIRAWKKQYLFIKTFLDLNLLPFNKNVERKRKLIQGFLNHRFTNTLLKYLSVIKNGNMTYKKLSSALDHRLDSIKDTLTKSRYQEFIVKNKNFISINNLGTEFIKIIDKLKELLKELEQEYKNYIKPIEEFYMEVEMEKLLPFEKRDGEIIARKEGKTNPEFGCDPNKRPINELIHYGIVNVNKPQGPTSHQISDYVQKIVGINKAGHSGTLEK